MKSRHHDMIQSTEYQPAILMNHSHPFPSSAAS